MPRKYAAPYAPDVMPQLRAAEAGTAECVEHAEGLTHRRRPVPPRVPRGISRGSLALDGFGLYPSRQKNGVPHVASASRPWGSWTRCPCHGRRRRSPSHTPLCDSAPLRYPPFPLFSPPPRRGIRPRLRPYLLTLFLATDPLSFPTFTLIRYTMGAVLRFREKADEPFLQAGFSWSGKLFRLWTA